MIPAIRHLLTLFRPRDAASRQFEELLGEPVRDLSIYQQALRHRSFKSTEQGSRLRSNERLEYLGDAVLHLVIAEHLYLTFPEEMEGFLSRMRDKMVNGTKLAEVARSLNLGDVIQTSNNAAQQGAKDKDPVLEDALEAVIGAVYMDRGIGAARRFIHRTMLEGVNLEALAAREDNFKTALQQLVQQRGWPKPTYSLINTKGPPHKRELRVVVEIAGIVKSQGRAKSRKQAEQFAARAALMTLRRQDDAQAIKKGHKDQLYRMAASAKWPKPQYRLVGQKGPAHAPTFTVEVRIDKMGSAKQAAGSKKAAQHKAARDLLLKLEQRTGQAAPR